MNMNKEIEQVYDSNNQDYYLIVGQKQVYFNDIYISIKNSKIKNRNSTFEILVDKISFKIKKITNSFFNILLEQNKTIPIHSPKIIKIEKYTRKCYNINQIYSFFDEYNIDPLKIIFKKEPINVINIFFLDEELIELELENEFIPKNEKFEIFKYELNDNDNTLLSDLIKGNKNYINFTKDSYYFITSKREDFFNSICKGSFSENNIMLYGPSGIGKTVSLLNYRFSRVNNVLYINLDSLFSFENKNKIYLEIIDELSFCFNEIDAFNDFIEKYLKKILIKQSKYTKYEFIVKCIKKIIKKSDEIIGTRRNIFSLIIDQYKYKLDKNKTILNALNKNKTKKNFQFLICASMDDNSISEVLYQNLFFSNSEINLYYLDSFEIDISFLSDTKQKYVIEFGSFPKYVEEISQKEEVKIEEYITNKLKELTNEIKVYILSKISNIDNKLHKIVKNILNNQGRDIDYNTMEAIYKYLPLKYIIPFKKKENIYIYKYAFPFIEKVLNNILDNSLNEIYLDLFENSHNSGQLGWNFEKLVKNYFKIDSIPFPDLNIKIKQEIQVDSIFDFKSLTIKASLEDKNIEIKNNEYIYNIKNNNEKQSLCKSLIKDGIIVINQNPCGESYDSALLIPNKNKKNVFSMLLAGVTLDKIKENFLYKDKICDSLTQIKNKFETIFDISISNFYFIYILYLQRKGTTQVEKLCSHYNNNLYYCYYEPKNNKLYDKNMGELKWELIKRNCKIINYSEDFKNFTKTNYYFTEINNSIFQKMTASKLKEENDIDVKSSILNKKERKKLINNIKLNIMTNFDNNIKIYYLNKKRRRKKAKKRI